MNLHQTPHPMPYTGQLFAYPFRLFFMAGSVWAIVAIALWILQFRGMISLPLGIAGLQWHAHEMIHGFTSAIIAGFLLTAMANWTGTVAPSGERLLGLFALWLLGRLSLLFSAGIPDGVLIASALAFYLALAAYAAYVLIRTGNRRNLIMPLVIVLLAVSVGWLLHAALQGEVAGVRAAEKMALYLITLLMVIIAGRITPAFTGNWLRQTGRSSQPIRRFVVLEVGGVIALLALAVSDVLRANNSVIAALALLAGSIHLLRLVSWQGWRVVGNPLLLVLHLGYLAVVASLFMRAGVVFAPHWGLSAWFHMLGVGAMGILIIGVMTRVSMGHTGRALTLPWLGLAAYGAVIAALMARMVTVLAPGPSYHSWLIASASLWAAAFALFLIGYGRILLSRRADGKPG